MRPFRHVAAIGGLATLLAAPMFVSSAFATDYTASGTIAHNSAAAGHSVTDREFRHNSCPNLPVTQGTDAYVFALPSGYTGAGVGITLTASSDSPHDLWANVYNADCSFDHTQATPASFNLSWTLGINDAFLVVGSTSGSNVAVDLTATPATTTGYNEYGTITRQATQGLSHTDTVFSLACPSSPLQGVDGYVFTLDTGLGGLTATATAVPSTHDLVAAVYNTDCSFDRIVDITTSNDLSFTLDADGSDGYVSIWTNTGANLLVNLTVA